MKTRSNPGVSRGLHLSLVVICILFASARSIAHGEDDDAVAKARRLVAAQMAASENWTIESTILYPPHSGPLRVLEATASANGGLALSIVPRPKSIEKRSEGKVDELIRRELLESFFAGLDSFRMSDRNQDRVEHGASPIMKIKVGTATVTIHESDVRDEDDSPAMKFIDRVRKLLPEPVSTPVR